MLMFMLKTRSNLRCLERQFDAFRRQYSVVLHGSGSRLAIKGGSAKTYRQLTTLQRSPRISVHPESSLVDEDIDIRVIGLSRGQDVTLRASSLSECQRYRFESSARYKANANGEISVKNDPSLGGSYHGIEPHGLLWSLQPIPEVAKRYPRFVKFDVTTPFRYTIDVLDQGLPTDEKSDDILASTSLERWYLADYVEMIPEKIGAVEGVWFIPRQKGKSDPLPVILDVRGIVSSVVVDRAALLSSHGFAVLALNYYHPVRENSKEDNVYIKLSVFEDIIEYIKIHPRLDESRVGVTSSCIGGCISLHATARLNLPIKCFVSSSFFDYLIDSVGLELPDGTRIEPYTNCFETWQDENGKWWCCTRKEFGLEEYHEQVAPVEKLSFPMLFFENGDEVDVQFHWRSKKIREKLTRVGKNHLIEMHHLPGTGHYVDAPYLPNSPISGMLLPHCGKQPFYTAYGGHDARMNARDQRTAWQKSLQFFRKHLKQSESFRSDWK